MKSNFLSHAEANGIRLNPDDYRVTLVMRGLQRGFEMYGDYYCPCKPLKLPENICPCVDHLDDIKKDGACKCRLFLSADVSS